MYTPTVLTIAGFDPYGGAGIQIDLKTIHVLGAYAFTATTAITAQNSQGVTGLEAVSPEMLHLQLSTLLKDIRVDAVKIGMLATTSLIEVVVEVLKKYNLPNIVLDPVMISSSGKPLLELDAIEMMVKELFPLCALITPNLMETNTLLGTNYQGKKEESLEMAEGLFSLGANAVLLKGGHGCEEEAVDCLVDASGVACFSTPRVETTHTHGTGCILSSAIATQLAHHKSLKTSVQEAKNFLYGKMQRTNALHLQYVTDSATKKEPIF